MVEAGTAVFKEAARSCTSAFGVAAVALVAVASVTLMIFKQLDQIQLGQIQTMLAEASLAVLRMLGLGNGAQGAAAVAAGAMAVTAWSVCVGRKLARAGIVNTTYNRFCTNLFRIATAFWLIGLASIIMHTKVAPILFPDKVALGFVLASFGMLPTFLHMHVNPRSSILSSE